MLITPLASKDGDILPDPELSNLHEGNENLSGAAKGTPAYWQEKLKASSPNKQHQRVIAGHGYRKPWETKKIKVPDGTHLHFYVFDTQALPQSASNLIEETGSNTIGIKTWKSHLESKNNSVNDDNKFDYPEGSSVYDYTITPSKKDDIVRGAPIVFAERTKLSSILVPGMGDVHLAICREIDWWGGFHDMPGKVHTMPEDWRYVRKKDYTGYLGPNGEKAPDGYGLSMMEPFYFDSTPL